MRPTRTQGPLYQGARLSSGSLARRDPPGGGRPRPSGAPARGGDDPGAARLAALPAALLALLSAACRPDGPPPPRPQAGQRAAAPRHLLLVVIDTLRADHVGVGGYPRATTPHLDELARRGVTFTQAVSQSPRTRTSMGALMTGLYPSTTGLTCQLSEGACAALPSGVTTLAEALASAGFATSGVISNVNVEATFGFDQGFGRYVAVTTPPAGVDVETWFRRTTGEVTGRGLAELEELAKEERFFLYLHYLDPHSPYDPPAEHRPFRAESYRVGRRAALLMSQYDGEIHFVDEGLGRLFARLEELGVADETAVVVTSDHGEEFNDHGGWNHGATLYDELLLVPLVVHAPGLERPGATVAAQVRLIDVVPTALDLLGVPTPPAVQGRSLRPLWEGGAGAAGDARPALSEAGSTPLASLRKPPWKLIVDLESGQRSLFHVERDPHERHEVSHEHPEVTDALAAELAALRAEAERSGAGIEGRGSELGPSLTAEQALQLEALGYGSAGS